MTISDCNEILLKIIASESNITKEHSEGIWYKGLDYCYHGCNEGYTIMMHDDRNRFLGLDDDYMSWAKIRDNLQAQDRKAFSGNVIDCIDFMRLGDGIIRPIKTRKIPVFDRTHGVIVGIRGISILMPEAQTKFFLSLYKAGFVTSSSTDQCVLKSFDAQQDKRGLTDAEFNVLYYLMRGRNSKAIADIINKSPRTIENHRDNLRYKFACDTTQDVISLAEQEGYRQLIPKSVLHRFNLETLDVFISFPV